MFSTLLAAGNIAVLLSLIRRNKLITHANISRRTAKKKDFNLYALRHSHSTQASDNFVLRMEALLKSAFESSRRQQNILRAGIESDEVSAVTLFNLHIHTFNSVVCRWSPVNRRLLFSVSFIITVRKGYLAR